MYTFIFGFKS
jgi:hypothetical protein